MLESFTGLEEFKSYEERYQKLLLAYQLTVQKNTSIISELLSEMEEL